MNWELQRHHLLFSRAAWNSSEDGRRLRAMPEMAHFLKPAIHQALHQKIEQIPLPDYHMMQRIKREFYPEKNDTVGTIRNFQEAVGMAMDNPYASDVAFSLGGLIIASMEAQIPYIEESERNSNGGAL